MTTPDEGSELLDVRCKWPSEPLDFTPWLAKNLCLLGDKIGMTLELVQEEKLIGSLYLDILAKNAETGELVAIENQLEWSDVDHMGRLLIYTAGCDAGVAIWVAPDFMYEHANTIHWLNEWTSKKIKLYCVKVEVVRKAGESCKEPRFRKVVFPGGWDKTATLPPDPPVSPPVQKHHDFYQPLIAKLLREDFSERPVLHFDYRGRRFPSRRNPGVGYAASLGVRNDAWVAFHIETDPKDDKGIFDKLCAEREAVESSIDAGPCPDWHWNRHDSYFFSSISVRRDGSIDDPPEKLKQTRRWMLDLLPKFQKVFDPRVENILADGGR